MNNLTLNHQYTPPSLEEINLQIEQLLSCPELDEAQLLQVITQREEVVKNVLRELESDELKRFASAELDNNQRLTDVTKKLLSESLGQLSSLIRGRKAVEKYK